MKRTGIMLCQPLEEKKLVKWQPPYIVQPKLDGERCRATWNVEGHQLKKPVLFTSEENIFKTVPHIQKAIEDLNLYDIELDGELYSPELNFSEIHSRCSSSRLTIHKNIEEIGYYVFDIVDENKTQVERLSVLKSLDLKPPLFMVPCNVVNSLDEIMNWMSYYMGFGYEGIIVRHPMNMYVRKRSPLLMKFKPTKEDVYEIVSWKEEVSIHGEGKSTLGSLICKGPDGNLFSVGSGLTDSMSEVLWKTQDSLIGRKCRVQYQHLTPGKNVPRFPVFMEII